MSVHMQVIRQYDVILIQEIQMKGDLFETFVKEEVGTLVFIMEYLNKV